MPIFEYECDNGACAHRFDKLRNFATADVETRCVICGSTARKVVSVPLAYTDGPAGSNKKAHLPR